MNTFGFDTNILAGAITRRFFSALHERDRKPIYVVPEVREELTRILRGRAEAAWLERLDQENSAGTQWSDEERYRIANAGGMGVAAWLDEMLDEDTESTTVMRAVKHNMQDALAVHRLLKGLRTVHFPGERDQGYGADRKVICQCMHHRLVPVITSNVHSISHDVLNNWAADWMRREHNRGTNRPATLLFEPEEAVTELTGRNPELIYRTVVGICLPNAKTDPLSMDRILRRTADLMNRGGLRRSATTVLNCYESDPDPMKTYSLVRNELPVLTRTMENRRMAIEKERVVSAGYMTPAM